MKTARLRKATRHSAETLEPRIAPATIFVSNTNDSGAGSLRQAVLDANLTPAADTILFKTTAHGTIVITSGQLDITAPLTVTGPGSSKVIISGNDNSRIFNADDGDNAKDSPFTIAGLSLIGGKATAQSGGAIYSIESLTVKNSLLTNNTASSGGAIYTESTAGNKILITGSTVSGNSATSGWGGGLYLDAGKGITILNTTVSGNTSTAGGGGAYLDLSPATGFKPKAIITGSIFTGNTAGGHGGGITADWADHPLIITKTIISGNSTPGAGGGLYFENPTVIITGSTIYGNTSGGDGAGIYGYESKTTITATRIIGNTSGEDGGGIAFDSVNNTTPTLTITGGLIAGNNAAKDGGGIAAYNKGKLIVKGTPFHGNRASDNGGAISTFSGTSLAITGGLYEGNIGFSGGAVDTDGPGTVLIKSAKFLANRTTNGDGGALYLRTTTTASITSSLFNGNSAVDDGGAIALGSNGVFTLSGLTVLNNTANGLGADGGGLAIFAGTASISKSLFKGNYSAAIGGGIASFAHTVTIQTTIITGNFARNDGGGIYATPNPTLAPTVKIFANFAPTNPDKNF